VIPGNAGHERVYRALLRLYPAAFRARFAGEMVQLFSDQLRDARSDGAPAGATRTWLRALGDLAVTAASEHARRIEPWPTR
jgi:putative ABC transport system permease protein